MTPAGLAPAPVAVFTCSREARRLIESGLKAVHRSLSGPHEVERLMFACDRFLRLYSYVAGSGSGPLDGSRILPTHTINCSIADACSKYNHEL
jgi:hypothetical protein